MFGRRSRCGSSAAARPFQAPPDAHPGQCYGKVISPPQYETYTDRVLVAEARRERRVIPAVYEWDERQVLVEPERIERHVIPATYRTVTETVVVHEATTRVEQVEPIYETVTEQVISRPARQEWRRTYVGPDGVLPMGAHVEPTGEVLCLVEVPAEYTTVTHRVLRREGRAAEIQVPAETRTVTREVIDQPEHVVETRVPCIYRTERYQRLVTPERVEYIDIPAEYATQEKHRQVSGGSESWSPVNCQPEGEHGHEPPAPYGERG